MRTTNFILTLLPSTLALSLPSTTTKSISHAVLTTYPDVNPDPSWVAASNSTVTCNETSDKIISFFVGPQLSTVLNDACAAMMPVCAYPPADTICVQTIDFKLDGPKNSTRYANIEDAKTGNKLPGWEVKFSVTPAPTDPASSPGVFWTKSDCFGYFAHIVAEPKPVGCFGSMGSGTGSVKVGGTTSLAGTKFDVEIVKRKYSVLNR